MGNSKYLYAHTNLADKMVKSYNSLTKMQYVIRIPCNSQKEHR